MKAGLECNVIMLPAYDKKSGMYLTVCDRKEHAARLAYCYWDYETVQLRVKPDSTVMCHIKTCDTPNHLYLYSTEKLLDDEIDNNVCMFISSNGMIKTLAGKGKGRVKTPGTYHEIEACTNGLLSVPSISEDFIKEYVQREGKIETVTILKNESVCQCDTMEKLSNCPYSRNSGEDCAAPNPNQDFYGLRPKVDEKGCVIIYSEEKTWKDILDEGRDYWRQNPDSRVTLIDSIEIYLQKNYLVPKQIK